MKPNLLFQYNGEFKLVLRSVNTAAFYITFSFGWHQ